jgi:GNAT superfamily N-acetyltransferase
MPGFAAFSGDEILGYLLYELHDGVCEIMVLESIAQNIGIATALIEEVKQFAKSKGVSRIIVQTSNDNSHAFRFYQRRGFTIREIRLGAMDAARKLKPSIPLIGEDGIPLRDEIEFEMKV